MLSREKIADVDVKRRTFEEKDRKILQAEIHGHGHGDQAPRTQKTLDACTRCTHGKGGNGKRKQGNGDERENINPRSRPQLPGGTEQNKIAHQKHRKNEQNGCDQQHRTGGNARPEQIAAALPEAEIHVDCFFDVHKSPAVQGKEHGGHAESQTDIPHPHKAGVAVECKNITV